MTTTTDAESNSSQNEQVVPISKLWWVGLIAAAGAATANLIFFWITKGLFDIPYLIPMGGPSGPHLELGGTLEVAEVMEMK